MKTKKGSEFIKNTILFLAGSVFSKLLSFILLPVYTTYIPTEDFGSFDIATLYITLISGVVFFEIWSAMLRYMYDYDDFGKMTVIKSSLKIFGKATLAFIVVSIAVAYLAEIKYLYLAIGYGLTMAMATYMSFLARGLGKNVDFAISGIINTSVHLGVNIFLVIIIGMDYSALYLGSICGSLTQVAYLLLRVGIVKKLIKTKADKLLEKEIFKYAFPLCLNTAAYWLLNSAARLIYNKICGDAASGVFSVGNKFGTIIVLATTCFTYAWQDMSFSESSKNKSPKLFSVASKKYLLFLTACLCVGLPMLKIIFPVLVKGDYIEAINFVPLFLVVSVVSGYSSFIGNIFYAIKDTKVVSLSTLASGIVAVIIATPLIKALGATGANLSVLIGFGMCILIRFALLSHKIKFKIPVLSILLCAIWIALTVVLYGSLSTYGCLGMSFIGIVIALIAFKEDIFSKKQKIKPNVEE